MLTGAGLYPNPIGKAGIAAVDVRDIADAAVVSLTTDGHAGKTYNLVGPDPLSGPSAAAIWSQFLNKQVRYADIPLEASRSSSVKSSPLGSLRTSSLCSRDTRIVASLRATPMSLR